MSVKSSPTLWMLQTLIHLHKGYLHGEAQTDRHTDGWKERQKD